MGKKINGRKRHLLVDIMGVILGVVVHREDLQDGEGARTLRPFIELYGWLTTIFVDGGYRGKLVEWVAGLSTHRNLRVQVVKRKPPTPLKFCPCGGGSSEPSRGWEITADVSKITK